jgi:hypothetical protein
MNTQLQNNANTVGNTDTNSIPSNPTNPNEGGIQNDPAQGGEGQTEKGGYDEKYEQDVNKEELEQTQQERDLNDIRPNELPKTGQAAYSTQKHKNGK